jgi:hypothetical protein
MSSVVNERGVASRVHAGQQRDRHADDDLIGHRRAGALVASTNAAQAIQMPVSATLQLAMRLTVMQD